jgi:co-chaperonin GroES (HSP10)
MKKIKPINDFVTLKVKSGETMIGGIIIPDSDDEKGVIAEVVAISKGIYNYHSDTVVPHQVKVGDTVVMPKLGSQKISVNNEDFFICQAGQLLVVIEDDEN